MANMRVLTGSDTTLNDIVRMTEVILVSLDANKGGNGRDIGAEQEPSHCRDSTDDIGVVEREHGGWKTPQAGNSEVWRGGDEEVSKNR